jgi:hypothetical protein
MDYVSGIYTFRTIVPSGPVDQKNRLMKQARLKAGGDEEAMFMDNYIYQIYDL